MNKFGLKISGTKITIKRPAPQSPANVRRVDHHGGGANHTHVKVPHNIAKKIRGGG